MEKPRAALFDLDDTLAETFQPPSAEMLDRLVRLRALMPVAIITGRDFARVEPGFLPVISAGAVAGSLFIMPESAALCLGWDGTQWAEEYSFDLTDEQRSHIRNAVQESLEETHALEGLPVFGEQFIEKRGQVAFAALGFEVPTDLKYTWDPEHTRRRTLQHAIAAKLPEFDVFLGGATSIDITHKGVNKAHGVRWLSARLQLPTSSMLYVGDALYPGGNDTVVLETGVPTRQTSGPSETLGIIDELLS